MGLDKVSTLGRGLVERGDPTLVCPPHPPGLWIILCETFSCCCGSGLHVGPLAGR